MLKSKVCATIGPHLDSCTSLPTGLFTSTLAHPQPQCVLHQTRVILLKHGQILSFCCNNWQGPKIVYKALLLIWTYYHQHLPYFSDLISCFFPSPPLCSSFSGLLAISQTQQVFYWLFLLSGMVSLGLCVVPSHGTFKMNTGTFWYPFLMLSS